MSPGRQQIPADNEATVAAFSFDETNTIDENLSLFFDHMATYDPQFADFLKSRLPTILVNNDRSIFNAALTPVLDAPPSSSPTNV